MSSDRTGTAQRPGLRERKKAKTRALIQEHALRLFLRDGYESTSIDDVADAAEVSRSTVLRYFPTKADLVIYDALDERIYQAFRAQPPTLSIVGAIRATLRSAFGTDASSRELMLQRRRADFVWKEPELHAAVLNELTRSIREMVTLVAERSGRSPDDKAVVALSGAVVGVVIAAWFAPASNDPDWVTKVLETMDEGFALLERGFNL